MTQSAALEATMLAASIPSLAPSQLIEIEQLHPLTDHTYGCAVCNAFTDLSDADPAHEIAMLVGVQLAAAPHASRQLLALLIDQVEAQDNRAKTEELVWAIANNSVADAESLQACFEMSLLDINLVGAVYKHPNCSADTIEAIEEEIDAEFLPPRPK